MRILNKTFTTLGLSLSMLGFFAPASYLNKFEQTPPPPVIFPTHVVEEKELVPKQEYESFPVTLSIESIGVYASIQAVGVLDGAMAVPDSKDYVGWYKYGTHPGENGSAVLAGHVNWRGGQDAVFTNLKDIQIGDIVTVSDNFGREDSFMVQEIQNYPIDTDTSGIFVSSDNTSRLNLITCYGAWNPERKTHDFRLVVFAEKI